jgi:putative RecB family exonuclease
MCPRKYSFQYVHGLEPEFRSTALLLGSALHSAIGWFFEERLTGRTPTIAEACTVLVADLLAGAALGDIRWKDKTPESLEEDGRRFVALYLERFGTLEVVAVEQPFQVDLMHPETGEVVGRPIKGFFDLVLDRHKVVELKSSSRGWNEFDLKRHLQVGAYAFVWNALHGGPSQLEVHVIVKLKREPRVETYRIERGEPDTMWWFAAAAEIERAIAAGHFPPQPSPLCGECEYERACAATGREAQTATVVRLPVAPERRSA